MHIHLIWAQDQNGGIGIDGKLPWHISNDLKNFKKLTLGSTVLMGRNTWESLPVQPLPERKNIVLSSREIADVECYTSLEECIEKLDADGIQVLFVIGGSSMFGSGSSSDSKTIPAFLQKKIDTVHKTNNIIVTKIIKLIR